MTKYSFSMQPSALVFFLFTGGVRVGVRAGLECVAAKRVS